MGVSEWTAIIGIVVAIIVPLGTLTYVLSDRARSNRGEIQNNILLLHAALDSFRVEMANDLGEIRGRILSIENRSFRIRRGDPDRPEM